MAYEPDPGGRFDSDVHRRVLGAVTKPAKAKTVPKEKPDTVAEIALRLDDDDYAPVGTDLADEIGEVLKDLEASGFVKSTDDEWVMTAEGYETVQLGPPGSEPGEEEE